jgi:hypothetical protein
VVKSGSKREQPLQAAATISQEPNSVISQRRRKRKAGGYDIMMSDLRSMNEMLRRSFDQGSDSLYAPGYESLAERYGPIASLEAILSSAVRGEVVSHCSPEVLE